MVEFSSNSTTASDPDGLLHASSKLKNSEPLDSFDSKPIDYSFADSFLDYDSLNDWIDEFTSPVMADAQTVLPHAETHVNRPVERSVPIVGEVQPIVQASGEACGKSTDLNCIIEEGMSRVSLVTGSGGLVIDGGSTGNIESDPREDDAESDVESEGTSSASTSSDSSSSGGGSDDEKDDEEESSSSSSSGDSSCDDDEETEERTVKADVRREIGELEDGEISDAENEDKEDSADDMVAWDGDGEEPDDEDEEARPEGGLISSKNELKVSFLSSSLCLPIVLETVLDTHG